MKIGIAGAGTIIPAFLKAQKRLEEFQVQAICATANKKEHLIELAQEYDIPDIYYSYEEMVRNCELDVIYIAVPNNLHYLFSKMALEMGKSVICEKPFCSNLAEAEELTSIALEKKLYLFEAISNQYFPNYQKVRELLPKLGDLKIDNM